MAYVEIRTSYMQPSSQSALEALRGPTKTRRTETPVNTVLYGRALPAAGRRASFRVCLAVTARNSFV
jgi:hypothetical protein